MIHFLFQKFLVGHCPSWPDPAAAYGERRKRKGKTERDGAELQKEMGEEREREPQAI